MRKYELHITVTPSTASQLEKYCLYDPVCNFLNIQNNKGQHYSQPMLSYNFKAGDDLDAFVIADKVRKDLRPIGCHVLRVKLETTPDRKKALYYELHTRGCISIGGAKYSTVNNKVYTTIRGSLKTITKIALELDSKIEAVIFDDNLDLDRGW